MKKIFIISMFTLGLVVAALFFIALVVVYFWELGFEISHGPVNFASAVLTTLLIAPMIVASFLGVAFFNTKLEERHKQVIS